MQINRDERDASQSWHSFPCLELDWVSVSGDQFWSSKGEMRAKSESVEKQTLIDKPMNCPLGSTSSARQAMAIKTVLVNLPITCFVFRLSEIGVTLFSSHPPSPQSWRLSLLALSHFFARPKHVFTSHTYEILTSKSDALLRSYWRLLRSKHH